VYHDAYHENIVILVDFSLLIQVVLYNKNYTWPIPTALQQSIRRIAFPVAAAQVWNGLPEAVISSSSLQSFRRQLKTHVFQLSYPHLIHCLSGIVIVVLVVTLLFRPLKNLCLLTYLLTITNSSICPSIKACPLVTRGHMVTVALLSVLLLSAHLRHCSSATLAVRWLPSAACTSIRPFDVRSSGLSCGRPGGLELVTRLPSRCDTLCSQFSS